MVPREPVLTACLRSAFMFSPLLRKAVAGLAPSVDLTGRDCRLSVAERFCFLPKGAPCTPQRRSPLFRPPRRVLSMSCIALIVDLVVPVNCRCFTCAALRWPVRLPHNVASWECGSVASQLASHPGHATRLLLNQQRDSSTQKSLGRHGRKFDQNAASKTFADAAVVIWS